MSSQPGCTLKHQPIGVYYPKKKVTKDNRDTRMLIMMVLNTVYMFCELIVGIIGNSLTLLGDSFHMLSDSLSLIIGFVSIKFGKRKNNQHFTFGYKRAEVLGAYFNASFLISVAFFLLTEIINKYIKPEPIEQIDLVLYTGIGGFVINFVGMFLFHDHGDEEEGHNHSHGCCHKHSHHHHEHDEEEEMLGDQDVHDHGHGHHHHYGHDHHDHEHNHEHDHDHDHSHEHADAEEGRRGTCGKSGSKKQKDLATHGVFLHVMGDFIGSIIAIASALVQKLASNWAGKAYVDPTCSVIMMIILLASAIPLLKKTIKILMMTTAVSKNEIIEKLMAINGVDGVHDLHVWDYMPGKPVAHCHIVSKLENDEEIKISEYQRINERIKAVFHNYGIHNVTINIEFVAHDEKDTMACFSADICGKHQAWCCPDQPHKVNALNSCATAPQEEDLDDDDGDSHNHTVDHK